MKNQTIKELLYRTGYRHNYLAQRIGISETSLGYFCSGRSRLTTDKLAQLARITGVSMDALHAAFEESRKRRFEKLNPVPPTYPEANTPDV